MKKYIGLLCIPIIGFGVAVPMSANRGEPVFRPETYVGPMPIGNLTYKEAAGRLNYVWEERASKPITLTSKHLSKPITVIAKQVGIGLNVEATLEKAPRRDVWSQFLPSAQPPITLEEVYHTANVNLDPIVKDVAKQLTSNRSPKVEWIAGRVVRTTEQTGLEVLKEDLLGTILEAMNGDGQGELPVVEAPKRVPDSELDKISEVVAEFSTKFPRHQTSRNTNIELGSKFLSGTVLMPGDRFSFNEVVGQRTTKRGFKLAGVYVNGRHDTGIGGGICQVSTTLYNAVLLANLKIVKRSNHSMPVAYVPVGRDATVSYNSLDLIFENSLDVPIAVSMEYLPGQLTARVLGIRDPGLEVKITTAGHKSWSKGEKVVHNPNLAHGKTIVLEKGSAGHAIQTFRTVFRDGKEIKRESLGASSYGGGVRIVARNLGEAKPAEPPPVAPSQSEPVEKPPVATPAAPAVQPPPTRAPRRPVRDSAIDG